MRAYRYIVEQAKKVNPGLSFESERTLADVTHISLDDLVRLKEGRDGLSLGLIGRQLEVGLLKHLVHSVGANRTGGAHYAKTE
jgi:hypothetical protein